MKILVLFIFSIASIYDTSGQVLWPCNENLDCSSVIVNTTCSPQKYCECPAGYTFSSDVTRCLKEQLYGLKCEENIQCSHMLSGSQCENGVCGCANDYTYVRGRCRKLSNLHESCRDDVDCFFGYNRESVVCKEGTCQCADEFYQRFNNVCRRKSAVGHKCIVHADCNHQPNIICSSNTCTPSDNSNINNNNNLSNDKNTDNNSEKRDASVQTQSFESISDNAYHIDKSSSFSNHRNNIHYNKLNSVASDGDATKFSSVESSVRDESTQFGDSCSEEHKQCNNFMYSVCRRGFCHCQDGFFEKDGICKAELGEFVESEKYCGGVNGIYKNHRCVCENHQFYHPDMRQCVKAVLGINSACTQQSQCSPYGAAFCPTATPKRCTCYDYALYNNSTELCEFKSGLGKYCQADEDCKQLNNAACSNKNTCQCKPNFVAQNDECKPSISAPCETVEECAFENAECKAELSVVNEKDSETESEKKFCTCKKKFIQVDDQCLDEAQNYNDTCIDNEQCKPLLGEKASCIDEKCQCDDSLHYKDGTCNDKTALNEQCRRSSECYLEDDPERAECRNSVCQCQFQYKSDGERQRCIRSGDETSNTIEEPSSKSVVLPYKFYNFRDSSSHPSPLKIITLLLIASATLITGSAIKDAYYP